MVGGPYYTVKFGRKDGFVSMVSHVEGNLPRVNMTMDQIIDMFAKKGFTIRDMVALTGGGHTIGFSHCSEFSSRLFYHSKKSPVDPDLNPKYATGLQKMCQNYTKDTTMAAFNDVMTPGKFDNMYYKNLPRGLGLLSTDSALFKDMRTRPLVQLYAANQSVFFEDFGHAMQKLSIYQVKTGRKGEAKKRMTTWLFKAPNAVLSSVSLHFSNRTFIKHLPVSTFLPRKINSKSLTTNRILSSSSSSSSSSSNFESLTSNQKQQVHLYIDALLQWNQKMNLTAVKDHNEVMERHIKDSLAIIPPIHDSYSSHENLSLIDVGSGPGLPGLILAIACPGWKVTVLESMKKRCAFMEHAVEVTGLSNVQVVRGRAEDLGHDLLFREKFDVAVARAVAEMRILAEYCLPLVRVGGLFVAAKGHEPQDEVKSAEIAIQLMGASVLQMSAVDSHSRYGQRTAIVCLKSHPTPRKYPRDPGTPAKEPL
ncbi:hypothetical protein ACFE04_018587 [Oxalis oulophora]